MKNRLGGWLFGLAAGAAIAQAQTGATKPQLYVQYAIPGDKALHKTSSVVIDAPLKLTIDTAGVAHLSVTPTPPAVLLNGTPVGAESQINIVSGPGVIITAADTPGNVTLQFSTSVLTLPPGCVVDANGNSMCPGVPPTQPTPAPFTVVNDERPTSNANGTWSLVGVPIVQSLACFRGTVLQATPADYTAAGNVITAPAWLATDALSCRYSYYPPAK